MHTPRRVTATNLGVHAHLQCDLYLHQSYYGVSSVSTGTLITPRESPPATALAAFTSGNAWETSLLAHLDRLGLLLSISGPPLSGIDIASTISLDERPHFFVAGVAFWPPSHQLTEEYVKHGVKAADVPSFGLSKPDLVEIWRKDNNKYVWRVIDAKSSKAVKTSHLVQTYFYHLCLSWMLPKSFIPASTTAIWLPSGAHSLPSISTLHATPVAPLVVPLTNLIFVHLPFILSSSRSDVSWHFNPLCRSCSFSSTCRARAAEEQALGKAGEITWREANQVRSFLKLSKETGMIKPISPGREENDIEDLIPSNIYTSRSSEISELAALLDNKMVMKYLMTKWPSSFRGVQRILGIQIRASRSLEKVPEHQTSQFRSPVIEAAITNNPQFTNRRVYTLPKSEDIAIFISLVLDPSQPASVSNISQFCISTEIALSFWTVTRTYKYKPQRYIHGKTQDLLSTLSKCIRDVLELHESILQVSKDLPRTQFYVWSAQERDELQKFLINTALGNFIVGTPDSHSNTTAHMDDVRICIGCLCEGSTLLATTFQPHVMEGALLGFLGKKGKGKEEMAAIMRRLGIEVTSSDTIDEMRQKIVKEINCLGASGEQRQGSERKIGLIPRVVVLKNELRRILAFPVPGWWDVKEVATCLGVTDASQCPTEEELFGRYWESQSNFLKVGMEARNDQCRKLLAEVRQRTQNLPNIQDLLVNQASVLVANWIDICHVEILRKLFYMQQFEVLLKLQELWNSRIDGCPDAPLLTYCSTATSTPKSRDSGSNGDAVIRTYLHHNFELISGNLEIAPERDRDRTFFDYLLVEDTSRENMGNQLDEENQLPIEALFDDLSVAGLVFPLNRYTRDKWDRGQAPEVKDGRFWVADVRDVKIDRGKTYVALRTWSSSGAKKALVPGKVYRLSPRLVDFNTTKMLSTLTELDLQTTSDTKSNSASTPLFVQLISRPKSFGAIGPYNTTGKAELRAKVLDAEASLHRLYTELRGLGNDIAGSLVLKASQRKAARRILTERLTVIWGPPGSGKSYTIALSLLRMLEVQAKTHTLALGQLQIIFVTAMTQAAIQACISKLRKIIDYYHGVPDLFLEWLDRMKMERVLSGSTHPKPNSQVDTSSGGPKPQTWIYAGTVYQLYTFGKRLNQNVDCIVIDEAGQLGLSAASLVLRALSDNNGFWSGKVIIAGDKEQLAPIFSGSYVELNGGQQLLFGSVLDCLMGREEWDREDTGSTGMSSPEDKSAGTVVQLLENFRLNPDLGSFVQTIYKRAFKPQKVQAKRLASQLMRLNDPLSDDTSEKARNLLLSLSKAMLGKKQSIFQPPTFQEHDKDIASDIHGVIADPTPLPISLAMVRLKVKGDLHGEGAYESHVRTEAKVAAALVKLLAKVSGGGDGQPGDEIFVACPHRVQRSAVNMALKQWKPCETGEDVGEEDEELERLIQELKVEEEIKTTQNGSPGDPSKLSQVHAENRMSVTVDTIERLQGSEASFVICLFSHTHRGSLSTGLSFLLARRRLNVAISRTKTLCIVISSEEVLQPGVSVFADHESTKGYAFLRAFQDRAWNAEIEVSLEI